MIQYKNTIEAIYLNLDEVQQLVAGFGTNSKIHTIELDLALDKLRNVYDLMLSLKLENILVTENGDIPMDVPLEIKAQEADLPEIKPVEQSKESSVSEVIKAQFAKQEVIIPDVEKEKTRAEKESRVRMPQNVSDTTEIHKEKVESKDVTDTQKVDSPYIKQKPVSNIVSALGLNEKFELIQNLFGGDKVKFEQTMNYLNGASDFNEAYEYLSGNFKWDMNNQYVQRILELIRKKLIVKKNER